MSQPSTKKEKKIHLYYEIQNGDLSRKLKKCPRCGTFMANHQVGRPRRACGGCSYTEYISS